MLLITFVIYICNLSLYYNLFKRWYALVFDFDFYWTYLIE